MKKIVLALLFLFLLFSATAALAIESSYTETWSYGDDGKTAICVIVWTAASDDALVDDITLLSDHDALTRKRLLMGWYAFQADTAPSAAAAPTANYDIVVNQNGSDLWRGALADRSDTLTELDVLPADLSTHSWPLLDGSDLTVQISNNLVVSASGTLTLKFVRSLSGGAYFSSTDPVPIETGDTVLEAALTLDTDAYADGDLLADTQELSGSAFLANGGVATVQNIQIQDYDDQKGALDIVLLRSNTSMGTENDAPSIADGNGDEILLVIPVYSTDYRDMGGFSIAEVDVGKVIKAAAADDALYIAAISRDTKTYTASGILVRVALVGRQ